MEILFTKRAEKDLDSIYNYYSELSETSAKNIIVTILHKIEILLTHPNSGRKEPTLSALGFNRRYLIEGNYKIIYFKGVNRIYITQIFDCRQHPDKLKG